MHSTVLYSVREGSVCHVELASKLHPFQHTLQMALAGFVLFMGALLNEQELSQSVRTMDGCALLNSYNMDFHNCNTLLIFTKERIYSIMSQYYIADPLTVK